MQIIKGVRWICAWFDQCRHGKLKGIFLTCQNFGRVCGRGDARMVGRTATHCMVIGREPEQFPKSVRQESTWFTAGLMTWHTKMSTNSDLVSPSPHRGTLETHEKGIRIQRRNSLFGTWVETSSLKGRRNTDFNNRHHTSFYSIYHTIFKCFEMQWFISI